MSLTISEATSRALQIRELFAQYEKHLYGREWSREEIALGFMGDIGDLMKLLQAKEGVRQIEDLDKKLAHEFADCLWALLVLAEKYDVHIESAFVTTMVELEEIIEKRLE